jgi:hypothetical protein
LRLKACRRKAKRHRSLKELLLTGAQASRLHGNSAATETVALQSF